MKLNQQLIDGDSHKDFLEFSEELMTIDLDGYNIGYCVFPSKITSVGVRQTLRNIAC